MGVNGTKYGRGTQEGIFFKGLEKKKIHANLLICPKVDVICSNTKLYWNKIQKTKKNVEGPRRVNHFKWTCDPSQNK